MSLINDALKRAKQAQQNGPVLPGPSPHLRPIESAEPEHQGLGLVVPAALAVVALLLLFFVWQWARAGAASKVTEVRAQTTEATAPSLGRPNLGSSNQGISRTESPVTDSRTSTAPTAPTSPGNASPRANSGGPNQASETASAKPAAVGPPGVTAQVPSSDLATNASDGTNVIAQVEKPAPLRLQGIVYTPNHSSAVINGKSLFVGDRIRDLRVVAISRNSVTLSAGTQKQVLTLEE
jgi:hypothetical protein